MNINQDEIRELLIDVFANSQISEPILDLKMDDIAEWDSMGNFNLLLAVEEKYGVQFDLDEMSDIRSVSSLVKALEKK